MTRTNPRKPALRGKTCFVSRGFFMVEGMADKRVLIIWNGTAGDKWTLKKGMTF